MSINLCETQCHQCSGKVFPTSAFLPPDNFPSIRSHRARYEVQKYLFCNARCCACGAAYLGWNKSQGGAHGIDDLSYRSTFNDEPGESDMPMVKIYSDDDLKKRSELFEELAEKLGRVSTTGDEDDGN